MSEKQDVPPPPPRDWQNQTPHQYQGQNQLPEGREYYSEGRYRGQYYSNRSNRNYGRGRPNRGRGVVNWYQGGRARPNQGGFDRNNSFERYQQDLLSANHTQPELTGSNQPNQLSNNNANTGVSDSKSHKPQVEPPNDGFVSPPRRRTAPLKSSLEEKLSAINPNTYDILLDFLEHATPSKQERARDAIQSITGGSTDQKQE